MIIEYICGNPSNIVMGVAGTVGALAMAGVTIYQKKKTDKKFKFDPSKIMDTIWQSALAGSAAGLTLGCGYSGILVAMVTGYGTNSITNKLKINKVQLLNVVELISKGLTKLDKKKK